MANDIEPLPQQSFVWTAADARAQVNKLYDQLVAKTMATIEWYRRNKRLPAIVARACRAVAVIFTLLGGACPIVQTVVGNTRIDLAKAGYLFLAVAAGALLINKYGGFSTTWIRYMRTYLSLDAALQQFQLQWQSACAAADFDTKTDEAAKITGLIAKLQQFAASVDTQVQTETQEWITEFQESLAALSAATSRQKEQPAAQSSGSIALTVTNFDDVKADSVYALLDGQPRLKISKSSTTIPSVAPGAHDVTIEAWVNNKVLKGSGSATVPAGGTSDVKLTIS
jgi:SMODS and SLOG-associating 2TM effector domain 2